MKEPGTLQNGDRFGTFVKRIRQKDPREITSIRLADYLGISPTRLCDIEANRRCPTDMEKVGRFCEFFHLDARVRSRLYELAAEARYTIPVFVGGDMTRYQQYDILYMKSYNEICRKRRAKPEWEGVTTGHGATHVVEGTV